MRALLAALLIVLASCSQNAAPSPSLSPSPLRALTVLAGPGDDVAERARLLAAAAPGSTVVPRTDAAGRTAIADLVAKPGDRGMVAVVGSSIAGEEALAGSGVRLAEATPIARLGGDVLVVAVPPSSPIANAADLRARLVRGAGSVRFAGPAVGSREQQLAALIVHDAAGGASGLVYAVYPASAGAAAAVAAGQADAVVATYAALREALGAKKLRALAVSSASRLAGVDLPTLRESGIAVDLLDWSLLVAPPGISSDTVASLRRLVESARAGAAWTSDARERGWADDVVTEGLTTFLGTEQSRAEATLRDTGLLR